MSRKINAKKYNRATELLHLGVTYNNIQQLLQREFGSGLSNQSLHHLRDASRIGKEYSIEYWKNRCERLEKEIEKNQIKLRTINSIIALFGSKITHQLGK